LLRALVGDDAPSSPDAKGEALARVSVRDLEEVLHPRGRGARQVIAVGLAASPGAATGAAIFDAWRGLDAVDAGSAVILVRPETSPADEPCLSVAEGVLTSRGGMASHAAVIARGRGLPAVCGASSLVIGEDELTAADGTVVREGELISIDGSTGEVILGGLEVAAAAGHDELKVVLQWADEVRAGRLGVWANADTAADAAAARGFGAEGIGLCRTEHQFLGADRLPLLRQAILADSVETERAALDQLAAAQQADFESLFEAMDGLPVTIRLLDPPLHEFLPDLVALEVEAATSGLDEAGVELLAGARRWHEHNPMLGVRGARLGLLRPDLYRAQVRAVVEAATAHLRRGGDPQPRVLVPLVSAGAELEAVRRSVEPELAAGGAGPQIPLGAMIETPRAALRAGEIAAHADFVSFGTNDLTQMTFGFSRDDVGRVLERYLADGLLRADPFVTLDADGVGELLALAVARARQVRPDISIGLCGEHGADPDSIGFLLEIGIDYVSCSPFRVPVARLAAAQALLAE
jgi:pyruvate,orthophosphate dikinase